MTTNYERFDIHLNTPRIYKDGCLDKIPTDLSDAQFNCQFSVARHFIVHTQTYLL
jgi:hypothetical protein